MHSLIESLNQKQMKKNVTDVRSGDTVRVYQRIKEGEKERTQVFEGMVIATRRQKSLTSSITVRRIASGVGVEKIFLLNSPLVEKVEVTKRSNVRRDKLNYMRKRSGKSTRLSAVEFDRDKVNAEAEAVEQDSDDVQPEANEKPDKKDVKEAANTEDEPKQAEEPKDTTDKKEKDSKQDEDSSDKDKSNKTDK